ncbi:MAG: two-component system sensor histidine kinase CreC [Akkermansiaceae bacterium]
MRLTRVVLFFVAFILALGFYRLVDYLLADLEYQTFQATEESMVDSANLLASHVEKNWDDNPVATLDDFFRDADKRLFKATIYKEIKTTVGLDAYLTDHNGIILYHSENPDKVGQDYARWHDVKRTLEGTYGTRSSREDEDDPNSSVMFVGAPIRQNGEIVGSLTVYKAQSDVLPFVQSRRDQIIQSVVLIGLGILALIAAVFVWLFRPVGQLTDYARAITRGERLSKPSVGLGREVNTLANALHDMRESLENREHADQYIQNLTHELKSPLAAIQGAAELLREEMPLEDRSHFLENIRNQTARCERLTHRLLELSAVEAQSHLEQAHEFDFTARCQKSIEVMTPLAETHQVTFETDFPPQQPYLGNELLIGSALNHLLENAIQFSPEGGTVAFQFQAGKNDLLLRIRDHGPGIPNFAAKRAFDRFYSFRPGAREQGKGNGLGLAFVKEVIGLHHGSVSLETHSDGGAEATLTFPLSGKERS